MPTLSRTVVVDEELEREASQILARIGMSVDDAFRLLLTQVSTTNACPFRCTFQTPRPLKP